MWNGSVYWFVCWNERALAKSRKRHSTAKFRLLFLLFFNQFYRTLHVYLLARWHLFFSFAKYHPCLNGFVQLINLIFGLRFQFSRQHFKFLGGRVLIFSFYSWVCYKNLILFFFLNYSVRVVIFIYIYFFLCLHRL